MADHPLLKWMCPLQSCLTKHLIGSSSFQIFLDLSENLNRCESWENILLELHWFSIISRQFCVLVWLLKFSVLAASRSGKYRGEASRARICSSSKSASWGGQSFDMTLNLGTLIVFNAGNILLFIDDLVVGNQNFPVTLGSRRSAQGILDVSNLWRTGTEGKIEDEVLGVLSGARDIARERWNERLFRAHNQVNLEPQKWYKEWVQCDVRTKCAHLYMLLCVRCYCSHIPDLEWLFHDQSQFFSNNFLSSSKLVFASATKFSWYWSPRWIEDFIVVDIRSPQTSTLTFWSSIWSPSGRFNFCRRCSKTFSTYRQSEICMLSSSNLVLSSWFSIPRCSFHQLPELSHTSPDERKTSITTSHKSRARIPSILKPASQEITSDSVELAHPTYRNECSTFQDT